MTGVSGTRRAQPRARIPTTGTRRPETAWATFAAGTGWYRNNFELSPHDAGKSVDLVFDGVQQESDVWINGRHLGFQPHGYIPFHYDLTPYLNAPGQKNLVAVRAINPERNSRWYPGSGIYRSVSLRLHDPLHVPIWACASTPSGWVRPRPTCR